MELGIIADLRNPPRPDRRRSWDAHYGGFLDLWSGSSRSVRGWVR
jgi:hypothetical protein